MARLTDYLLKLAHDANEHKKFRESKESAIQSMTQAGLNEEHKALLLAGDCPGLHNAIAKEFASQAVPNPVGCQSCTTTLSLTLTKTW